MRDVQAERAELHAQRLPRDAERARGAAEVAPGVLEGEREEEPVDAFVRAGVDVRRLRRELLADEGVDRRLGGRTREGARRRTARGGAARGDGARARGARPRREIGQERREERRAARREERLLDDTLELADVARPGIGAEAIEGRRRDVADVAAELL